MKSLALTSAFAILWLALSSGAVDQHRMIRLCARQHQPYSQPAVAADSVLHSAEKADPQLKLTQDSDADLSLAHDESMRLFMRAKAECVIASQVETSLSTFEVDSIISGTAPSLHPGSLVNVSWTLDMFESGTTLPTTSSSSKGSFSNSFSSSSWSMSSSSYYSTLSPDSDGKNKPDADTKPGDQDKPEDNSKLDDNTQPDDASNKQSLDLNHDGVISVDELLYSFFHADHVKSVFDKVQAETKQKLGKEGKKQIIKEATPVLHKTIEMVASHRGWGIQDARFAQLHVEGHGESAEAFKDYNTFVKTMRSALITPKDAAKDSAKEQENTPRTDPSYKA